MHYQILVYITQSKIQGSYTKNSQFQISTPTKNDEFQLNNESYSESDIQDYFNMIMRNMK